VHFLNEAGKPVAVRGPALPCPMTRPGVAVTAGGLLVHGNCFRAAYLTDTMKAVLAWSADTTVFRMVAEDVRFTTDGSVGSVFGAPSALTSGVGRHLFGGGITNCVWEVVDDAGAGGGPAAHALCPAAAVLYSAEPPAEVARRIRAGIGGMKLQWPATLPVYLDRVLAGGTVVLLRPFSTDSLVLQTAAPDARSLAVAPVDGLVGCRAGGCLWVFDDGTSSRGVLLEAARLAELVAAAGVGQ
jgi:hypothetical protein